MNSIKIEGKIEGGKLVINNEAVAKVFEDGQYNITIAKKYSQRTDNQNRALHLYFTQLADALNDAGFDMRKTIRESLEIPWTAYNIKEFLWRPAQKAYLQKQSTTELDKVEDINHIYDIVNKIIGERTGVFVPFPSLETMIDQENQ